MSGVYCNMKYCCEMWIISLCSNTGEEFGKTLPFGFHLQRSLRVTAGQTPDAVSFNWVSHSQFHLVANMAYRPRCVLIIHMHSPYWGKQSEKELLHEQSSRGHCRPAGKQYSKHAVLSCLLNKNGFKQNLWISCNDEIPWTSQTFLSPTYILFLWSPAQATA